MRIKDFAHLNQGWIPVIKLIILRCILLSLAFCSELMPSCFTLCNALTSMAYIACSVSSGISIMIGKNVGGPLLVKWFYFSHSAIVFQLGIVGYSSKVVYLHWPVYASHTCSNVYAIDSGTQFSGCAIPITSCDSFSSIPTIEFSATTVEKTSRTAVRTSWILFLFD